MSVIVKGVKMPKDCWACVMSSFGACNVVGRIWDVAKRPDWCPLHPLPEKHGRLIDIDALPPGRVEWEDVVGAPIVVEAEGDQNG